MKIIQPTGQLFGQTLKNIKLPDLDLSEGTYSSGIQTPQHTHRWALLCLVLKGSYIEKSSSKQYTRSFSTAFFHPPEEPHISDFRSTHAAIFQIEIAPQRLGLMGCMTSAIWRPMNFERGIEVQLVRKIYREFKWMDEASPLAIEGLTLELLAAIVRSNYAKRNHTKPPDWLYETRDFLHDNFSENHSLDKISIEIGVHPKYLATEFRRHYNLTIGEYIRRLRVDYACRELANSKSSLAEIAIASGFYSQSHFCRTFKQLTGFTPAQYRKDFDN